MTSCTCATLIHLGPLLFCRRFIPYKEDPRGKRTGQMVDAARSGRQNIIEGSERASTSKETEMKLTDVARSSLAELLGDFEMFLADVGESLELVSTDGHRLSYAAKVRLVDAAEYKRRQSPPGVKITPRAFGRDRRLPITNRWRG